MLASVHSLPERISLLRPTAVNAILAEVKEARARGKNLVSLMRGEPDFKTAPHIIEACTQALANGRTNYPDNRGEKILREAVSEKLHRDNGLTYDPGTEILATTGATLGIYAALMAILNEGDEVLLPDPIYDAYQSPIRLAGGRIRTVASAIHNGRFVLSEAALEAAWTPSTRALIINTPWNPVGTVLSRAELETITDFCEHRDVVLLSDEIYEAITYDGAKHISPLAISPGLRGRAILLNSLSKTYAMTGWRVGYCAGPAALIQAMFLVLAQSSRGPATFIQDAAAAALTGPQECVAAMRTEYARRRSQVLTRLSNVPGVRPLAPEGGFFAMADIRGLHHPSNEVRRRLLEDHGVVVVHGAAYGPGGEGTLRISFGRGGDTLTNGLERLARGLTQIQEFRS